VIGRLAQGFTDKTMSKTADSENLPAQIENGSNMIQLTVFDHFE
jgi:hypothetical protein